MNDQPLLTIQNLGIRFPDRRDDSGDGDIEALRGVSLSIGRGEVHCLVGESGSGKSVTAKAVIGLNPMPPGILTSGKIVFDSIDLVGIDDLSLRRLRGKRIGMVFQEPSRYLSPSMRIGEQIAETVRVHLDLPSREASDRAKDLLRDVGLDAETVSRSYPHELSGGMRQRAMIAIAISCGPELLIADEPTTALDVTVQRQIIELLMDLADRKHMAVLFVSHDLAVVRQFADRVSVIYAGKIVETGSVHEIFDHPVHPYTRMLLESIPDASLRGQPLRAIRGQVPDPTRVPSGCAFHPRCPIGDNRCSVEQPKFEPTGENMDNGVACHKAGMKWNP